MSLISTAFAPDSIFCRDSYRQFGSSQLFASLKTASVLSLPQVFGILAGFGTTFASMPDLIAMLRRRSSAGINPRMAAIMGAFQILWIYYGLIIASRPVILWTRSQCWSIPSVSARIFILSAKNKE